MDHAEPLSRRERFKQALKNFWRAHIVDEDPYDAFENECLEVMIRAMQAAEEGTTAERIVELAA